MDPDGWKDIDWHPGVRIVASGPDWVVVAKPAGVLSHPNSGKDRPRSVVRSAFDGGKETFSVSGGELGLAHRLDGPTSGVLVLARPGGVLDEIRAAFSSGRVLKKYQAIVIGRPSSTEFHWADRLGRRRIAGGGIRVTRDPSGESASTNGWVLGTARGAPPLCRVRLEPKTGRTHQLRVQAALRRIPILGDSTYGDFRLNRALKADRLFLHAEAIRIELGAGMVIEGSDPAPEVFDRRVPPRR